MTETRPLIVLYSDPGHQAGTEVAPYVYMKEHLPDGLAAVPQVGDRILNGRVTSGLDRIDPSNHIVSEVTVRYFDTSHNTIILVVRDRRPNDHERMLVVEGER